LTPSIEEEDFPSMTRSGDDVWVAYVRFVHGDRTMQLPLGLKNPLPKWVEDKNFDFLARPTGGDQVLVLHYSIAARVWTGPFAITGRGEDIVRTAVAVDGQNRAWIFYSARRGSPTTNYDIYAKRITPAGDVSSEARLTTAPGADLNPVASAD